MSSVESDVLIELITIASCWKYRENNCAYIIILLLVKLFS